ncbi:MAG: hypothetical protein KFW21_04005 [Spirochaetota bacterium]|nr:hypothetical protein [Spirochaetota bacterium]
MKLYIILYYIIFLTSCIAYIPMNDNNSLLMERKLENTEWQSKKSGNKQKIHFLSNEIKLGVGKLLGTTNTPFSLINQDQNYALYSIYEDYLPSLLGVIQIDTKTIRVLIWQGNSLPLKQEIIDNINQYGIEFSIKKKKNIKNPKNLF